MHETGLARDLLTRAELVASGESVRSLRLEIGVLSGISADHLEETIARLARQRWGVAPEVIVTESEDPTGAGATGVTLVGIKVRVG